MTTEYITEGQTINPATFNNVDFNEVQLSLGKQGECLGALMHGQYYSAALRGNLFSFNVTAVTVPVIASSLASVFSLYNPPTTNKVLELIDFDMGFLTGTTVIDVVGLYWQQNPISAAATFTTAAAFGTNVFGGSPGRGTPSAIAYTSLAHSGTPVRVAVLNSLNTTSVVIGTPIHYDFKGKIVLFPGDLVSVAVSTTHLTNTTTDLGISWAEWPYPA